LVVGNLDQLREAARRGADSLLGAFRAGDTVRVEVGRTQGSWLLEVALLERAAASGITLRTAPETQTGPAVRAYVSRAAITYDLQSDGDSVRRRADLYIESIAARSPAMLPDEPVTEALHIQIIDTIAISDSSLVAGPEPFLAPPFPIRSSEGFWELVAEPAIVLGAAVIMTILLFSVRSSER